MKVNLQENHRNITVDRMTSLNSSVNIVKYSSKMTT